MIGMFLDLKKAFDNVDHQILLKRLHTYGIRGNILYWFESYLTGRSQYGIYDGQQSEFGAFIIYMNDISNVSEILFTILYADDTSVLVNGKNFEVLSGMLKWASFTFC